MTGGLAAAVLFCGLISLCIYFHFRRQFVRLSSELCRYAEQVMQGESLPDQQNRETLTSKVVMELEKMERMTALRLEESRREKQQLLEMISEITHQIKTPVSNLRMYCEMLSEEEAPMFPAASDFVSAAKDPAQQDTPGHGITCSSPNKIMEQQLIKLDFLLDTLLKASRLETDMIHPDMENRRILDTLAAAVNNIMHKAELKHIEISVDCRSSIQVCHDRKWTAEAIGNILDNAVKYTPEGGTISILVRPWQFYTRIDISDTGIGIDQENYNAIFQRFYRAEEVTAKEGVGLGLYLARGIIAQQNGYITVRSKKGEGSTFSVFLLS